MTASPYRISPVWLGIGIGALVSLVCGWVYLVVLREPGPAFYPFAGLVFLGGPFIGGFVALLKAQEHRGKAFFAAGSFVFGLALSMFFLIYVVLVQFDRVSVELPAACDGFGGSFNPPAHLAYTLPNTGTGILITSDSQSAVVAMIDYQHPPFPSTVYLVNKADNTIIQTMHFKNEVVIAAIDDGTLVIYNDKLGYLIDARTGQLEQHFLIVDNYGGLSGSDRPILPSAPSDHSYLETNAVISSWNIDGTVKLRNHLTLDGIARGCFVSGDSHDITPLDRR